MISDYNGYGVSCPNAFDGFIDAQVHGGSEPYTYDWDDGQTLNHLTNLSKWQLHRHRYRCQQLHGHTVRHALGTRSAFHQCS